MRKSCSRNISGTTGVSLVLFTSFLQMACGGSNSKHTVEPAEINAQGGSISMALTAKTKVSSLTLINADSDKPQPLDGVAGHSAIIPENAVINLAVVGQSLNIRANISGVGSVLFDYDNGALTHVENVAPYAFASDSNGDYSIWTPSVGAHVLKVTPYAGSDASGLSGTARTVHFTVKNSTAPSPTPTVTVTPSPTPTVTVTPSPTPTVTVTPSPTPTVTVTPSPTAPASLTVASVTLINADSDLPQALDGVPGHSAIIPDNAQIDLSKVGSSLNIRADNSGAASILFDLDNGALTHIENVVPYALASDTNGDYNSWTPTVGPHTLKVAAYSGADATGNSGPALVIHFSVINGVSPSPTPTVIVTPSPSPSPSPSPTATGPGNPANTAEPSSYSAPITITQGGTYSGNWKNTNSNQTAVIVDAGSAPVIIQNCHIAGPGRLIELRGGGNLTVRNCSFHGKTPTVANMAHPRAITAPGFRNLVIENNFFEGVSHVVITDQYNGDGSAQETIKVRYNIVNNIDGRQPDGGTTMCNFVAIQNYGGSGGNPRFAEIAWNRVINTPFQSNSEDLINFYSAGGRSDSWFKVHDNLLKGSYAADPANQDSSGSGMIVDGDQTSDSTAKTSYIESYNNTVLNTTNAGMNISAGHDIHYYNNRIISSGKLPDGRWMPASWAGVAIWNLSSGMYNVGMEGNTIGWSKQGYTNPYTNRNDVSSNEGGGIRNNTFLPNVPITLQMEADEINLFSQKVIANGIRLGPQQ
ncbi:MAG: hypothetical protein H7222_13575 [Methylotenera sp.]|nr:hypothetical protein [Oligoflexia bacterium]